MRMPLCRKKFLKSASCYLKLDQVLSRKKFCQIEKKIWIEQNYSARLCQWGQQTSRIEGCDHIFVLLAQRLSREMTLLLLLHYANSGHKLISIWPASVLKSGFLDSSFNDTYDIPFTTLLFVQLLEWSTTLQFVVDHSAIFADSRVVKIYHLCLTVIRQDTQGMSL